MNRTLLNLLTWGTIASAVVCALLLAAAVDDLDPAGLPSPRRPAAAENPPLRPVGQPLPEAGRASPQPAPSSVRLAERG